MLRAAKKREEYTHVEQWAKAAIGGFVVTSSIMNENFPHDPSVCMCTKSAKQYNIFYATSDDFFFVWS